jgi:hypothetical protein
MTPELGMEPPARPLNAWSIFSVWAGALKATLRITAASPTASHKIVIMMEKDFPKLLRVLLKIDFMDNCSHPKRSSACEEWFRKTIRGSTGGVLR